MITPYKFQADAPYCLHDMRICKIERAEKTLKLSFEKGYVAAAAPYRQVNGSISIQEVDYDFCFAYVLSKDGRFGTFRGEKLSLQDFLKKYPSFSFEVVDESFGYNSVVYNGYLLLPKKKNFLELTLTVYHFGNILYETGEDL